MIKVDQETCIGCGLCASLHPEIFAMNSEAKAEAIAPESEDKEGASDAAVVCPVGAIKVD